MLIQHRISAAFRREKRRSKIAIGEKHGNGAGEHRQRQQQQESRHQDRPGEQRHLVQGHARRPHIEDGGDEIDRAEDRRRTREMHRQDHEIDGRPRVARGRQRRVERPTGTGAVRAGLAFDEHRDDEQRKRRRQQPERYVVHARKRHVRRADHQRHHPVAKSAHHRRHEREKDHDQAMAGYEHVVGMRVGENLQARLLQFHPNHNGNDSTDQARADREHEVHRADVFVVGRIKIAPPAARICVGFLVRVSNFRHSRHH